MDEAAAGLFRRELRRRLEGEVLTDLASRLLYSTDASLYQVIPAAVVVPKSRKDVGEALNIAASYGIPILPRGGGTSLAGQAVTHGLVIDFSKYLNRVIELDLEERRVRVEPGIILDNLNALLAPHGMFFAPDVATSSRANIGGMLGNNSSGVRSLRYGKTVDHVASLNVLLSSGQEMKLSGLDAAALAARCQLQTREGELYRQILRIVRDNADEIEARFPKVMRRVGGYNLDSLLDENDFNLSRLIVGSEGTLACILEAELKLEPLPRARGIAVLHFSGLLQAIRAVERVLLHRPTAVEILDGYALHRARENLSVAKLCESFIHGEPEAVLIVEFSGDDQASVRARQGEMVGDPGLRSQFFHAHEAWEAAEQTLIWQVRKSTLGILLRTRGDFKPVPFIEDSCVPVRHLADYISRVLEICRRHGREVALYAHASVGVIHVRPILNLKQREDVEIMKAISGEAFKLVVEYGGSWSGEHGDGLVRSYRNREFFGDRLYEAFHEVKEAFDPRGLMNPGKIVDSAPFTENLRIHPAYSTQSPPTHFRFEQEMGFDRAIELCTGVGHCRKTLAGTMCPSFMATLDEEHSTRGRANALRSAIAGHLDLSGLTSPRLYQVLDLCVECKACKSECPTNVDMAKLKAEFLAHYYDAHGLPLRKWLAGNFHRGAAFASHIPRTANAVVGSRITRWALDRFVGIDRRRKLPLLARRSLLDYVSGTKEQYGSRPRVALFVDCFSNFFEPSVGLAAHRLLESLGFGVSWVFAGCCGRPLISSGQLRRAKSGGDVLLKRSRPWIEKGLPVIVLEPSCYTTFKDEYPDLVGQQALAIRWADQVVSLEEFLTRPEVKPRLAEKIGKGPSRLVLHGHCQQKALFGIEQLSQVLRLLGESAIVELDSGCCGMAGLFGYEKEHFEISRKIGNVRLFPALEELEAEAQVVASGFSCRTQIEQFAGRPALHPAQVLAEALRDS